jgi:glycosyltransferase involved in cell wall biosynthesis
MPEVSVILTTHNRIELLPRALESVRRQTVQPLEVIVVADGCNDGTAEWLAGKAGIKTIIHSDAKGISAARNAGIALARGEWLAFLDDDDAWLPNKLEQQLEAIRQAPGCRLCHSDEIWIRHGKRVNAMNKHRKQGGWIYPDCLPLCVISPSAVMIQRHLFDDVGGFDTSLPACEDYDLWLRICAREPVLYVDQPLITKYGGHPDQLSRKYWGMDRFRIQALENILLLDVLSDEYRKLTLEILTEKIGIYIQGARKRGRHHVVHDYQQRLHKYETQLDQLDSRNIAAC